MSKMTNLTARLQIRIIPSLLAKIDTETGRLRMSKFMFGNRRPKQAAIVMTALRAFLDLTPGQRDALYERYLPVLENAIENPASLEEAN